MAVREWLFDRQGRYVVDKPPGWAWGPGELDTTRFILVRADLPNDAALRSRRKGIDPATATGTSASVVALSDREAYVIGQRWLNLRTGQVGNNQDEALGSAQEGDGIFVYKRLDTEDDATGWLIVVRKLSPVRLYNVGRKTLKEAQQWLS